MTHSVHQTDALVRLHAPRRRPHNLRDRAQDALPRTSPTRSRHRERSTSPLLIRFGTFAGPLGGACMRSLQPVFRRVCADTITARPTIQLAKPRSCEFMSMFEPHPHPHPPLPWRSIARHCVTILLSDHGREKFGRRWPTAMACKRQKLRLSSACQVGVHDVSGIMPAGFQRIQVRGRGPRHRRALCSPCFALCLASVRRRLLLVFICTDQGCGNGRRAEQARKSQIADCRQSWWRTRA